MTDNLLDGLTEISADSDAFKITRKRTSKFENSPLLPVLRKSHDESRGFIKDLPDDSEDTVKAFVAQVRGAARVLGYGVRIGVAGNRVSFMATDKRAYTKRAKDENSDDSKPGEAETPKPKPSPRKPR